MSHDLGAPLGYLMFVFVCGCACKGAEEHTEAHLVLRGSFASALHQEMWAMMWEVDVLADHMGHRQYLQILCAGELDAIINRIWLQRLLFSSR